jgi:hypothetical protein
MPVFPKPSDAHANVVLITFLTLTLPQIANSPIKRLILV